MAYVHEVMKTTVELEQIKTCKCADKNRMDLICPPRQCDACQSGLEHLDGRRHDDNRKQVIP